ncbi:short-chain dehydrogenase/reductase SDR [Dioszegia hungarica]|uniref:Short-chain dehydrogenase/reductase SDR n=1 Tax=Dioszegia hungarica TaxID=4972 RepID=A0AA38H949_9TREE|nr:short-chain dehydrogenase/reductase SDR [Dioszegia hungarica]KAI9636593.1 short-chain dehydrogenase/reductase SDR [Dioszegia hungarica]
MTSITPITPGIALVTGASSGIGRSAAIALHKVGWTVILVARRKDALEDAVQLMNEGGGERARALPADLSVEEEVLAVFETIKKDYGRLDLLFNNAGMGSRKIPIEELPLAEFRKVMELNVTASFICAQEAVRLMKAQSPKGGRIINNGSISAYTPRVFSAPYTMSKHAILGLTKCLALDGRADNIACSQLDIGNANSGIHGTTEMLQPNGNKQAEEQFHVDYAGQAVLYMASLPLGTLMATTMPFVGRG